MTERSTTSTGTQADANHVVRTRAELRSAISALRAAGSRIGFVPTMGALHTGHLSLVAAAQRECDAVVVSIFVNPTQFGPQEDFARYPRDLGGDLARLAPQAVDVVFAPSTEEMYGTAMQTTVEPAAVAAPFEGTSRPGHFRGVATIVLKLLNLVTPDVLYLGQKDFQQSLVVRRMIDDLDLPVELRVCPTVREPDGLALSSRNAHLTVEDRARALVLSRALARACQLFAGGERDAATIAKRMREMIEATPGVMLDYAALADSGTLVEATDASSQTVALVAARVGKVRLIDNCLLSQTPEISDG